MAEKWMHHGFLVFLILTGLAFQWPVENPRVTSIFGESRGDHFHDGIDMISTSKNISPVEDGELVYFWDHSLFPLENYPGGGNYKVLSHRGNLYSIYLHLDDSQQFSDMYARSDTLGTIGSTGRSYGKHLHLSFLDRSTRKSFNPLKVLPDCQDGRGPAILEAFIRVGERYTVVREGSSIRLTRHYPLLLEVVDSMGGGEKLGVFGLQAYFNGKRVLEINFTEIEYSKNELTISGKNFHNLFDEKGYYRIDNVTYVDGINTLRVVARDFRANEATKEISFNVKLEISPSTSL